MNLSGKRCTTVLDAKNIYYYYYYYYLYLRNFICIYNFSYLLYISNL